METQTETEGRLPESQLKLGTDVHWSASLTKSREIPFALYVGLSDATIAQPSEISRGT